MKPCASALTHHTGALLCKTYNSFFSAVYITFVNRLEKNSYLGWTPWMVFSSYLFTFLSTEKRIALFFLSWRNFVSIVRDNCVFHQLNFPFLLKVAAAFLLLEADEPGNSLISPKYVGMVFRWQIQTFLPISHYSLCVPVHRAKVRPEKGIWFLQISATTWFIFRPNLDWAVLSSACFVPELSSVSLSGRQNRL